MGFARFTSMESEQLLRAVFLFIEKFRRIAPEMPTQLVSTFLSVALKPGILASEVAAQIGTTLSSTSRHARDLSDVVHKGKPGYGLIEQRGDPTDRRRRRLHLTAKGQSFVNELLVTANAGERSVGAARTHGRRTARRDRSR